MFEPLASKAGRLHLCAHRGHSAGAPENTLPTLEAAAARGADVAEIDVVLTADDEIVLLHDEILDRTTDGTGRVDAVDLAAVKRLDAGAWFGPEFAGTRVPTLLEALETARPSGMALLVEIKERQRVETMIERLVHVFEATGAAEDALVISFDHVSLVRLRQRYPAIRTELISHARHVDPVAMAERAGATSVAIEWDMFHPEDARALHAAGIAVRISVPGRKHLTKRREHGFDDEARLAAALQAGDIDVLAGDDVDHLCGLAAQARAA